MPSPDPKREPKSRDRVVSDLFEPVEFFSAVSLGGALIMAAAGALFEAVFLAFTFIAMVVLRRLDLPRGFELSVAVGVVLQGWGNALLLFERIGWYDKAVHFLTPLLVVPSIYLLLVRVGALPSLPSTGLRRGALGVLVVTVAIGTALAALWELVEGSADRWLGTSLAHGYLETIDDLYSSVLGSVAAGALLTWLVVTNRGGLSAERHAGEVAAEGE